MRTVVKMKLELFALSTQILKNIFYIIQRFIISCAFKDLYQVKLLSGGKTFLKKSQFKADSD